MGKNDGFGIGGWVGLRAHLDIVEKIKLSCLYSGGLIRKSFLQPEVVDNVHNFSGNYLRTVFITWLWSGNSFVI
jgi:hypothetical protein